MVLVDFDNRYQPTVHHDNICDLKFAMVDFSKKNCSCISFIDDLCIYIMLCKYK